MRKKLIDLTQTIFHNDIYGQHPLDTAPYVMPFMTHEDSFKDLKGKFSFAMNYLAIIEHTSTHVDAQNHVSSRLGLNLHTSG